jgi:hypothetical protein
VLAGRVFRTGGDVLDDAHQGRLGGPHYGCKFVLWRMFYEESWNSAQPAGQAPAAALTSNTASNQSVSVANTKGSSADPVAAASAPAAGPPKLSSK